MPCSVTTMRIDLRKPVPARIERRAIHMLAHYYHGVWPLCGQRGELLELEEAPHAVTCRRCQRMLAKASVATKE